MTKDEEIQKLKTALSQSAVEGIVSHFWLIGILLDGGWMCEGIFVKEEDAVANCKEEEFILFAKIGERLPEDVKEAECIYWPHKQTKEEGLKKLAEYKANG